MPVVDPIVERLLLPHKLALGEGWVRFEAHLTKDRRSWHPKLQIKGHYELVNY